MFFWLSCLAAGLSLCLLVWVITRPAVSHAGAPAASDHGMFRLLWPWIVAFSNVCRPFISWSIRHRLHNRLQVAGLDRQWLPEHIVAMQLMLLCIVGCFSGWMMTMSSEVAVAKAVLAGLVLGAIAAAWPPYWLRSLRRSRQTRMLRELPFLLDMTTLCVEAGLNLQGALQQAAQHGPPGPLRMELRRTLMDIRAGMPRQQALEELARRTDLASIRSLVLTLAQADQLGMSLGPLLRAQSEQRRSERFLRAEKLALQAPVKMLFPMVFCIFPCTFLIIGFPIAIKLLASL